MKANVELAVKKLFSWADFWDRLDDVTEEEVVTVVDYLYRKLENNKKLVYGEIGHYADGEPLSEIAPIFYEEAVCIYRNFDSLGGYGDIEIVDYDELYLTVEGNLYHVNCVSFKAGSYYVEHRRLVTKIEKQEDLFVEAAGILDEIEDEMDEE